MEDSLKEELGEAKPGVPQARRVLRARLLLWWCVAVLAGAALFAGLFFYWFGVRAPERSASTVEFTVPRGARTIDLVEELRRQGFIRNDLVFELLLVAREQTHIAPGGYLLSGENNAWEIASILSRPPALVWITLPPGARKEQNVEILAQTLGWSDTQKKDWLAATLTRPGYAEGVYFPDTYLLSTTATPAEVVAQIQEHFDETYAPYAHIAVQLHLTQTQALTLASLIEREAAGPQDMALISGIIWNRLDTHMPLGIDAALQYVRGESPDGQWWGMVKHGDTLLDSPYNTYRHIGLPPAPIASPSLDAIKAALAPQKTDCLFYLHDSSRQIHCSATFAGQRANIEKYLK